MTDADSTTTEFILRAQRVPEQCAYPCTLALPGLTLTVQCNREATANALRHYFAPWVSGVTSTQCRVSVFDCDPVAQQLPWREWPREPGKTGLKDTYLDEGEVRLVRKHRTGMVFIQTQGNPIAMGPCADNLNQIVNFINNQAMNALQNRGYLIGHAAAASHNHRAIAIAGFSGGGKSTAMLKLMDYPEVDFISNDRVFIGEIDGQITLTGVAKMPRVNPGTIVNNPRLETLIEEAERESYRSLSREKLWELERKYDVPIPAIYGSAHRARIERAAPLQALILLNWQRDTGDDTAIKPVNIEQREDLLPALMKSSGPFYQDETGYCSQSDQSPDPDAYLPLLQRVPVYEVTGAVDFDILRRFCASFWQLPTGDQRR